MINERFLEEFLELKEHFEISESILREKLSSPQDLKTYEDHKEYERELKRFKFRLHKMVRRIKNMLSLQFYNLEGKFKKEV